VLDSGKEEKMKSSSKLRELIKKGVVLAPGAWDALSAKIVEKMGFQAIYMTGAGVSGSLIGKTDLGYVNQTEMLEAARHIRDVVNIPLIADIDDGFGNPLNVQRTIKLSQRIGIAAVQMEDMEMPKRCSHIGGARLGPAEVMVNKIKAAVEVKEDPDFMIIARTDNYEGVDEVIRRAKLYAEAGADMILPVALPSVEEIERAAREIPVPLMDGQIGGSKSPQLSMANYEQLNIKLAIFPLEGYALAYMAHKNFLSRLKELAKEEVLSLGPTFTQLHELEVVLDLEYDEQTQVKYFPKA
jgi:methylisocitrate lyase